MAYEVENKGPKRLHSQNKTPGNMTKNTLFVQKFDLGYTVDLK